MPMARHLRYNSSQDDNTGKIAWLSTPKNQTKFDMMEQINNGGILKQKPQKKAST